MKSGAAPVLKDPRSDLEPPADPAVLLADHGPADALPPLEAAERRTSWRGIAAMVGAGLVIALVIGVLAARSIAARLPNTSKDPSATATASAAMSPGAGRIFGDALPPSAAPVPASMAASTAAPAATKPIVPAADADDVPPIEVRADGSTARTSSSGRLARRDADPDDGPALIALASPSRIGLSGGAPTARGDGTAAPGNDLGELQRSFAATQQSLGAMVDRLTNPASSATSTGGPSTPGSAPGTTVPIGPIAAALAARAALPDPAGPAGTAGPGLFGGQLQSSAAAPVQARQLGQQSLVLPKGSTFTCALRTKVVSATSGLVGCQVLRNVYSADGRAVLIERGSQLDGEYRVTQVRPGVVRVPTIWTRVRTPHGVIVDIESPAVGPLGESGLPAHVDNRWMERLGAALLVGFIDDVLKILVNRASDSEGGDTIVLGTSAAQHGQGVPEKILESTINIPPLLTQNQGGLVGVYIARDVDFSTVYALQAVDVPTSTR